MGSGAGIVHALPEALRILFEAVLLGCFVGVIMGPSTVWGVEGPAGDGAGTRLGGAEN